MINNREIEILSHTSNAVVIKLPGRKHPSVVLQGDSLHNLSSLLIEAIEFLKKTDVENALETCDEANELLLGFIKNYEAILEKNNLKPPYLKK